MPGTLEMGYSYIIIAKSSSHPRVTEIFVYGTPTSSAVISKPSMEYSLTFTF